MSVLVFAENWDGKFKKQSYELVTYARQLADIFGYSATVVSIGNVSDEELRSLGRYGADKIVKVSGERLLFLDNQSYTSIIAGVAADENATVLVLANNNTGKAVAPRLSVRMKAGMVTGVNSLPSGRETFVVRKKVFSGKAFASVRINSDKKIITLARNSFEIRESPRDPAIVSIMPEQVPQAIATEIKDVQKKTGRL